MGIKLNLAWVLVFVVIGVVVASPALAGFTVTTLPRAGVSVGDLSIMAATWYPYYSGLTSYSGYGVSIGDLSLMAGNWGWEPAENGVIPEPGVLSLMALGGLALLRRRKA